VSALPVAFLLTAEVRRNRYLRLSPTVTAFIPPLSHDAASIAFVYRSSLTVVTPFGLGSDRMRDLRKEDRRNEFMVEMVGDCDEEVHSSEPWNIFPMA
jgi:hypothetical protein